MTGREVLEADALRAFAVFAEHLNFTTAAAELHLSQPSLHVKIRKVVAALGVELYERQGRGLVLTAAGQRLAAFAHDSVRRADDFLAELNAEAAPIAIAAGRGAFRWVIGDGVARLALTGRALRILTAGREDALAALTSGEVDLAVVAHDPPPPQLAARELAVHPQVLLLPRKHRLARRTSVQLAELDGVHLLVPPPDRPHRRALDRCLLDAGVTLSVAAEVEGWDLMAHFARLGMGAAIVNGCVQPPAGVAAVPIDDLPQVRYWAVWRHERTELAGQILAQLLPTTG